MGESLSLNRQRVWKSLELLDRQLSGVDVVCIVVSFQSGWGLRRRVVGHQGDPVLFFERYGSSRTAFC